MVRIFVTVLTLLLCGLPVYAQTPATIIPLPLSATLSVQWNHPMVNGVDQATLTAEYLLVIDGAKFSLGKPAADADGITRQALVPAAARSALTAGTHTLWMIAKATNAAGTEVAGPSVQVTVDAAAPGPTGPITIIINIGSQR